MKERKVEDLIHLLQVQRQLARFLHEESDPRGTGAVSWTPSCDVIEAPGCFRIYVDLPGVGPEDIQLRLTGQELLLRGRKQRRPECETTDYRQVEIEYGEFARTFSLPSPVDADGIQATLKSGVLSITVKKTPPLILPIQTVEE